MLGWVHTDDHPYIPMAGIWAEQDTLFFLGRHMAGTNYTAPLVFRTPHPNLLIILIGNLGPMCPLFKMSSSLLLLPIELRESF